MRDNNLQCKLCQMPCGCCLCPQLWPITFLSQRFEGKFALDTTGARWVWLPFGAVIAPRTSSTRALFTSPSITTFRKPLNIIPWHVPCGRNTSERNYCSQRLRWLPLAFFTRSVDRSVDPDQQCRFDSESERFIDIHGFPNSKSVLTHLQTQLLILVL